MSFLKRLKTLRVTGRLFIMLSVLYLEIVAKIFTSGRFFDIGLIFMPIFSLLFAALLDTVCSAVSAKKAKIIAIVAFAALLGLFGTQVTYHSFFNKFLVFFTLTAGGAEQLVADGLLQTTLRVIFNGIPAILLSALPLVAVCVWGNKRIIFRRVKPKTCLWQAGAALVIYIVTVLILAVTPLDSYQSGAFDPNLTVRYFGLIRTELLDLKYNLFGFNQKIDLADESGVSPTDETSSEPDTPQKTYSPNVMSIDFAALAESETDETLASMNSYFAGREPTLQNEYTGMYKGYNLILMTAEGFSPYAVRPDLTPTLYKMSQEGFKFTNFYTPIWGVSTSDGEYVVCNGLIPKAGVWSFYRSGNNLVPFCLGNQFKKIGVEKRFAYHANSYNFYHREASHPNMGYTYKAYGNGLEDVITNQWPQSDLELVEASLPDLLSNDGPFIGYYMTVSGHLEYNRLGNSMSNKNWAAVADLDCSETLKAYYACNIELDKALERLLAALEEAGVADKTVIAITPDHYPYGLEKTGNDKYEIWREILGHDVETEFELYKSNFILYCPGTKDAPTIDKYCSAMDILPTLSNLFGLEYDSRLLMGSDILSTAEPLVIFSDRSFITSVGKYNSVTGKFIPHDGQGFATEDEEKEYISGYKKIINNKFQISTKILETDYYRYLFE